MQKNIIILIISLFIIACNNNSNEYKSSDNLCIVLKDGTKFDIPQSNINSYYASISRIIMNSQKETSNYTNTEKLYDALINAGYTTDNIGDKQTFINYMRDENTRKEMYQYIQSNNDFRIGDYNTYLSRIASDFDTDKEDCPTEKLDLYDLRNAYDKLEMTHNDKIVYATLWLIDNGYEFDVFIELNKHVSNNRIL